MKMPLPVWINLQHNMQFNTSNMSDEELLIKVLVLSIVIYIIINIFIDKMR